MQLFLCVTICCVCELISSKAKMHRVDTRFPANTSDILTNGNYWYIVIDSGIPIGEHLIIGIFNVFTKWNLPMFVQRNPVNVGSNYGLRINVLKSDFSNVADLANSGITLDIGYIGPEIV